MSIKFTVVTPSFEKHFGQYRKLLKSAVKHCSDIQLVEFIAVLERKNVKAFEKMASEVGVPNFRVVTTESIFEYFRINRTPSEFLRYQKKFTFQSLKKLGGLLSSKSQWSLVLDSECIFFEDFSIQNMFADYSSRKYVFYTPTDMRGDRWKKSLGAKVNENTSRILGYDCSQRWYMDYFHWFYETDKVKDLVLNKLGDEFVNFIDDKCESDVGIFENVIYYCYLEKYCADEYSFVNLKDEIDSLLPKAISRRYVLNQLPFAEFGNDYLLSVLAPQEVKFIKPLFDKYKLPFIRLETPVISAQYISELRKFPSFVATVSSHYNLWSQKRIAVCISGDFRYEAERGAELQVRAVQSFLSGVDCDIYIHGWSNSNEGLIIDQLRPKKYLFEDPVDFSNQVKRIKFPEPRIKSGRDAGSLSMLYSWKQCFNLLDDDADYDFVVRVRPDIAPDRSLKELLLNISDPGDLVANGVYVPKGFHSKGVNDQFAVGSIDVMRVYFHTYDYALENLGRSFFNPEFLLLSNLINNDVRIAAVYFPYALMRSVPMRINEIHSAFHEQERVWWSRTDGFPELVDVTPYFKDKMLAVDSLMKGRVPQKVCFKVGIGGTTQDGIMELLVVDDDPSRKPFVFFRAKGHVKVSPCSFYAGGVGMANHDRVIAFVIEDGNGYIVSQWVLDDKGLSNEKWRLDVRDTEETLGITDDDKINAWGNN